MRYFSFQNVFFMILLFLFALNAQAYHLPSGDMFIGKWSDQCSSRYLYFSSDGKLKHKERAPKQLFYRNIDTSIWHSEPANNLILLSMRDRDRTVYAAIEPVLVNSEEFHGVIYTPNALGEIEQYPFYWYKCQ